MKVIGIRPASFTGLTGEVISGQNIYVTYPLEKGVGAGAERLFMTDANLGKCGYVPVVGDEVNITYNKYGKVDSLIKVK